ncbi:MAG TPA: hypothetical protein VFK02_35200 [Kofleriaceae bacterium]|nr:hypothetical protein [Kofleriaceae bacterium]
MMARRIAVAMAVAIAAPAAASPLAVVVRDGGDATLAVARLHGQLADLEIDLRIERGPIEPTLDGQLEAAARLAADQGARAVVWFVPRRGGLVVAIATPADHRLFVREIPAAAASTIAEAAAVAARSALRAIADGGTIGVEVPIDRAAPAPAPAAPAPAAPARRLGLAIAIGWQVALDGGADAGAHALAGRTTATSGPWGAVLAVSWGPALRRRADGAAGVTVDLSRSSAALGVERRFGELALGAAAGVILYHRATIATPADLSATAATTTAAFVAGPELRWQWRPGGGAIGAAATAGLDLVLGAPDPAIERGMDVASLGALHTLQPRFMASIFAELR